MGNGQTAVQVNQQQGLMSVGDIKSQINHIQRLMKSVMTEDVHYGKIPGCGVKPALLKAGAEKIAMAFQIAPKFIVTTTDMGNGHREYYTQTSLYSGGNFIGEGVGSCSTMETKWRYRNQSQRCPECGQETIIKGKSEYGGGWLCFKKKGGCGAKFSDADPAIVDQPIGKIEHEDPADYWNTCRKISKKRSLNDGILTVTAASDIFTQDIDESPELYGGQPVTPKAQPDRNLRKEVGDMLMEMCLGDIKAAETKLYEYSGKTKLKDITEAQIFVVYGKVKKAHDMTKDTTDAEIVDSEPPEDAYAGVPENNTDAEEDELQSALGF